MKFADPKPISISARRRCDADVFLLGAGFEDRAERFLAKASFKPDAHCILVRFDAGIAGNKETYERYGATARAKFAANNLHEVDLPAGGFREFEKQLESTLASIPRSQRSIWIDVSGLPAHVICTALRLARSIRPLEQQTVIYTAATEYNPTLAEYEELRRKSESTGGKIEYLPRSMALEMGENYIPDSFSGHRTNDRRTALAVFAGYEVHRSVGVIDNINPSILLLLFGRPGDEDLSWRLDLSQELHSRFPRERKCATEIVSTLRLSESLDVLERYYNYLYDDFDLTIAPVCSKMHTVASYLFWERYKEIQLAFPLPIGYDPKNRPVGAGQTYRLDLSPARILYPNAKA